MKKAGTADRRSVGYSPAIDPSLTPESSNQKVQQGSKTQAQALCDVSFSFTRTRSFSSMPLLCSEVSVFRSITDR